MAEREETRKTIERLRREVERHEALYRKAHQPEISDPAFDRMLRELQDLEAAHPEFASGDSPTRRVGDDRVRGFPTARHLVPMQSLDNTYSRDELFEFDRRLRRLLGTESPEYRVEPKIDGLAICLTYRDGRYEKAVTRGNGEEGDVVTDNVRTIHSLPGELKGDGLPRLIEIRGEVYMTRAEFDRINAERAREGRDPYMNPRNLASGTLKQLDAAEVARRKLEIVCYGVGAVEGLHFSRQQEIVERFADWGLPVVETSWTARGIAQAWEAIQELEKRMAQFAYATDGAVLKLNDIEGQRRAGSTSKAPRWAISYKFAAEQAETRLNRISIQVGRTGALTPVAELEPVRIAGTTVSRATLHNEDEIRRKDIREGDAVIVEKAGEVIPAVVRSLPDKRSGDCPPFDFEGRLRELGYEAERVPGEAAWRLKGGRNPQQLRRRLEHFAGRRALDIEGLGTEVVRQLVESGRVHDVADLYGLSEEDLRALDHFAEKSAANLYRAIQESRQADLWRLIHGLGIPLVGAEAAKVLAARFRSMEALLEASEETLQAIEGIGPKMARSLRDWAGDPENVERIRRLREEAGFHMESGLPEPGAGGAVAGKTFVLTGSLPNWTRDEAKLQIEEAGGRVTGSVSSQTDYLVAGEGGGGKRDKAVRLKVPVIDEETLRQLLGGSA